MANRYGPRIIDDGLVFCMDAAGDNKSYPIDGLDVEYLIVAGGGAGGFRLGGGGGAGGLLTGATKVTIATGTYSIVVGAGGASITASTATPSNGSNSSFAGFVSVGGGGGGQYHTSYSDAANGGSGGGAASWLTGGAVRGTGTTNQGNSGGYGARNNITSNLPAGWSTDNGYSSGGGGGAGSVGANGVGIGINAIPGNGGIGKYFGDKYSVSFGENGWFAGGGGGQQFRNSSINAVGGLGGGGRGAGGGYNAGQIQYNTPTNAQANTGGGGGGGGYYSGEGGSSGSGGSGIVLIRYSGPPRAKGGDSIISHKGYTIHVFTSSGNFIVGETVSDLSTSKNYGTLTNMSSSTYNRGRSGYWSFDGTDETIITSIPTTIRTVFIVFRRNGTQTSNGAVLIGKRTTGCFNSALYLNNSTALRAYSAGPELAIISLSDNTWYHITVVAKAAGGTDFYVNGEYQTGYSTNFNCNELLANIGSSCGGSSSFKGDIALIQAYSTEFTSDQIRNNFNTIKGRYGL